MTNIGLLSDMFLGVKNRMCFMFCVNFVNSTANLQLFPTASFRSVNFVIWLCP